ncbi:MAG TPA: metal ABC transporter permease [Anaeromyxobacteraceae bacterium]
MWRDPLLAALIAGALLGFLGVYVVLRRTVFVSAALTQLSTLGLVAAIAVEERLGVEVERAGVQLAVAVAFSVAGALLLSRLQAGRRLPSEAGVGIAWVIAGALAVLGASQLVHAAHDLGSMVFGSAVAVPTSELAFLAAVALGCAAVHALFVRELVLVSFDAETARAMGIRAGGWNAVLFLTLGLAIPPAARAIGALPTFAFLTLPAAAALLLAARLPRIFAVAAGLGAASAAIGYGLSWTAQLPTGATMVAVAGLALVPGAALRLLRG